MKNMKNAKIERHTSKSAWVMRRWPTACMLTPCDGRIRPEVISGPFYMGGDPGYLDTCGPHMGYFGGSLKTSKSAAFKKSWKLNFVTSPVVGENVEKMRKNEVRDLLVTLVSESKQL